VALSAIDAYCDGCGHTFSAVPRRSFLGFQLLNCPACATELRYPLTRGYRSFYEVCAGLMTVSFVVGLVFGHLTLPGLVGGAMIAGLIKDRLVRRELVDAAAERATIAGGEVFRLGHERPGGGAAHES